ncbi:actin-like ATPase domain-containing protein [Cucurbitaria berberidis CBS 394.84]|uniref:Actin-like ATPase domain-containing protein n=1 Tax=Cucurbitaria berberidis CBS 394.84 TaxID=1168544 RepID=A0A9P4GB68_9PLEO|nr:actin-like ATPase domain-containing protein [Cucurbitaria berberidis CBS 394.84]KAF1842593.1 actin-like ATPase domain-containing protein [Cucurbitaria berberidis CBS 394.84]
MAPSAINDAPLASGRNSPKPPPAKIWSVNEPPFEGFRRIDTEGYARSNHETAIVIDNGSSAVRAGWSFDSKPRLSVLPNMARYRDRKLNRTFTFVGSDVYSDGTARGQSKPVYEPGSNIVNNWDAMEGVLDYCFIKMGLDGRNGRIDRPIVMTEPIANLGYSRKTMSEILFECYGAPSVAYGIDSLFSYSYNGGRNGLIMDSSYTSTHLIPVIDSKPLLSQTTRLNWGRFQSAQYLLKLLRLKYPTFPGKISDNQAEDLVREHCYVSQNYEEDLSRYLDWTGLEDRNHIVQFPYTEAIVVQKTEEELAAAAEKRKESGRRLQAQAAKMRLDKLKRKEEELEYYIQLQAQLEEITTKKEKARVLESNDFDDENQLNKKVKELESSIKKARNKDVGDVEEEQVEEPTFPLLEVPDDQLDEEGIKQKRQQRLMKSNYDARQRAKIEKEKEKARQAEEQRLDDERRETDPQGWIDERRIARQAIVQKMKDRERLKAELGNRKSLANQMRMKSIANLASDNPTKKRRRGGGDDDTFGADDADWGVYRTIATGEGSDDEEEEDLNKNLKDIESQLLKHDPNFTEESTREAQTDWTKSILHSFLHGPYPFDHESQKESNQVHLNVERIRVPEVVFQPSIAGLDQAGIIEIASTILNERLADSPYRDDVLKDIFLTGGNTLFQGFEERLRAELRAVLPAEQGTNVRRAKDCVLDAWRGAAQWAGKKESKQNFITKAEFLEKGAEYIKEHDLGNASY